SQPDVTRYRVLHAQSCGKVVDGERNEVINRLQPGGSPHEGVMRSKTPAEISSGYYVKIVAVCFHAQVGHARAVDFATGSAQVPGPARHRKGREARACRSEVARYAVVQHRNAVQFDLPALLHRIIAEKRPARLPD